LGYHITGTGARDITPTNLKRATILPFNHGLFHLQTIACQLALLNGLHGIFLGYGLWDHIWAKDSKDKPEMGRDAVTARAPLDAVVKKLH
jgi:hypothetical protein